MDSPPPEVLVLLSQICAAVMIVLCLFGVVGNSLSLYIYTRPAFRKRSINILLSALSASDLAVCVLSIPVFSSNHLQYVLPGIDFLLLGFRKINSHDDVLRVSNHSDVPINERLAARVDYSRSIFGRVPSLRSRQLLYSVSLLTMKK
ncbi:hypothetical protein ANCCAN_10696 [Ancylostoma caninum]|uniref:G-protein coupled receptors family 1 profile domain-containing protein n=1 Tax=Ancylostoma caninum TaxID=29170 RepID=A0A368GG41_ANCCA|nr:hypothetical protein ANCCAN_10696 [Ancylostoma caninum]